MTHQDMRKGMDPMVAGAIALAGAADGAAATMYFSKEENRNKLRDKAQEMKDKAEHTMEKWKHKGEEAAEDVQKKSRRGSIDL